MKSRLKILKKEKGFSLLELMIAGLILLLVALFVSSVFLRGSIEMTTSWDDTVATNLAKDLLDEIKWVSHGRSGGRYVNILMTKDEGVPDPVTDHLHINIATLISGTSTPFTVAAHNNKHEWDNEGNAAINATWTTTANALPPVIILDNSNLNHGLATGVISFSDPPAKYVGTFTVEVAGGTIKTHRRLIIYPSKGEEIGPGESDIPGTVTRKAVFEMVHDTLDGLTEPANPTDPQAGEDALPGDYMQGTITVSWGQPVKRRNIGAIIAPWPEQ